MSTQSLNRIIFEFEHILDDDQNVQTLNCCWEGKWNSIKFGGCEDSLHYSLICRLLNHSFANSTKWSLKADEQTLQQLCRQLGLQYKCKSSWRQSGKIAYLTHSYVFTFPKVDEDENSQTAEKNAEGDDGNQITSEGDETTSDDDETTSEDDENQTSEDENMDFVLVKILNPKMSLNN